MTRLTIYGDFDCQLSALASARADARFAAGTHEIAWRAIQHDTASLVLLDGHVSRGLGALARLAESAATRVAMTRPAYLHAHLETAAIPTRPGRS